MVKQVLLKCLCTLLFLFLNLKCSNCGPPSSLRILLPRPPQINNDWYRYPERDDPDANSKLPYQLDGTDDVRNVTGYVYYDNFTDVQIKKFKLWPNGVVPYYIDVRSFSDKVQRDKIRRLLNSYSRTTHLEFMELRVPPKDNTTRWVFFINRRGLLGCADHSIKNFTNEGVQQVVLGYECMSTGGELAEAVLAIAGVPAQHNAPDRDDYIKVVDENILPEKKYLFEKLNKDEWLFDQIKYDFSSAGHYDHHKYSANGLATIDTQDQYSQTSLGDRSDGLSHKDIIKLKMLYYNAKKKEDQISKCNKLFIPSTKFNNAPLSKVQKKPNKQRGIPEDNVKGETEIDDIKDTSECTSTEHFDYKDNDKSIEKLNGASSKAKAMSGGIQILNNNVKTIPKRDPLSYLSDYHTGGES